MRKYTSFTSFYPSISISSLHQQGLFHGSGRTKLWYITFRDENSGASLKVAFALTFSSVDMDGTLQLVCWMSVLWSETGTVYRPSNILLQAVKTPFNGLKWYFACYNEEQELTRYTKLYLNVNDGGFYSRGELRLTYESKYNSRRMRLWTGYSFRKTEEARRLLKTIKYPMRRGQPTKKFRKYLTLMQHEDEYWKDNEAQMSYYLARARKFGVSECPMEDITNFPFE